VDHASPPVLLKDHTADELHAQLAGLGVNARLARRLQAAVMQRRATEIPTALPEVSSRLLGRIRAATAIPRLNLLDKAVSPVDGFAKYLFRGIGAEPFESVRIPLLHRPGDEKYIVCVSSQVGCALGCVFCATGRLGFRRNLATWEIVDQVMHIQADSPYPVRGVVFMGMGEPLLNYDRVMRAARILSEPCGVAINARAITVSTVGVVPMIRRFTAERRPYRLVVSLTSADPVRRRELLPVEQHYPLSELMAALRDYHHSTRRRVTLAWTLLSGINTRPEDARATGGADRRAADHPRPDRRERPDRSVSSAGSRGAKRLPRRAAGGIGHAGGAPVQRRPGHIRWLRHARRPGGLSCRLTRADHGTAPPRTTSGTNDQGGSP